MNILEASFKILNIIFKWILHDDLLRLNCLNVTDTIR